MVSMAIGFNMRTSDGTYARHLVDPGNMVSVEFSTSVFTRLSGTADFIDHSYKLTNDLGLGGALDGYLVLYAPDKNTLQPLGSYVKDGVATIPIKVMEWNRVGTGSTYGIIRVRYELGSYYDDIAKTTCYRGMGSVQAITALFSERGCPVYKYWEMRKEQDNVDINPPVSKDETPKDGGWYSFMQGMYDSIEHIKRYSLLDRDYLMTYYDELRSSYAISAVMQRFESDHGNYVVFNGTPPITLDNTVHRVAGNIVYTAADVQYAADTGRMIELIYPNVAYLYGDGVDVNTSTVDFSTLRLAVSSVPVRFDQDDLKGFIKSSPTPMTPAYGPRHVKYLSNANTHPLHSFAEDYRRAAFASFHKKVDIRLDGTYGPPLGDVATLLLNTIDGVNNRPFAYDAFNSGRYMLYAKHYKFDTTDTGGALSVTCHYMSNGPGISDAELQSYPREITSLLKGGS